MCLISKHLLSWEVVEVVGDAQVHTGHTIIVCYFRMVLIFVFCIKAFHMII